MDSLAMKLVISIDVEEEGLFCGEYPRRPPGVRNVAHLRRLEFVTKEFGVPLTLLATYPVAWHPACQEVLLAWRDDFHAEIGAHLHPWNTPPFVEGPGPEPVPSDSLPMPLMRAKLQHLVAALRENLQVVPGAFRMGRFDLGMQVRGLLPECSFRVDSSVVPLHGMAGGPDHFLAPSEPYWLETVQGYPPVLEVPLTVVSISNAFAQAVYHWAGSLSRRKAGLLLTGFRHAAALSIHPAWHPLISMQWAACIHRDRGGQVLNMFLHSSELAPGMTPAFHREADVERLVRKIRAFLEWLTRTGPVHGVTLSELYETHHGSKPG
jgi:hypothetical protein